MQPGVCLPGLESCHIDIDALLAKFVLRGVHNTCYTSDMGLSVQVVMAAIWQVAPASSNATLSHLARDGKLPYINIYALLAKFNLSGGCSMC